MARTAGIRRSRRGRRRATEGDGARLNPPAESGGAADGRQRRIRRGEEAGWRRARQDQEGATGRQRARQDQEGATTEGEGAHPGRQAPVRRAVVAGLAAHAGRGVHRRQRRRGLCAPSKQQQRPRGGQGLGCWCVSVCVLCAGCSQSEVGSGRVARAKQRRLQHAGPGHSPCLGGEPQPVTCPSAASCSPAAASSSDSATAVPTVCWRRNRRCLREERRCVGEERRCLREQRAPFPFLSLRCGWVVAAAAPAPSAAPSFAVYETTNPR